MIVSRQGCRGWILSECGESREQHEHRRNLRRGYNLIDRRDIPSIVVITSGSEALDMMPDSVGFRFIFESLMTGIILD